MDQPFAVDEKFLIRHHIHIYIYIYVTSVRKVFRYIYIYNRDIGGIIGGFSYFPIILYLLIVVACYAMVDEINKTLDNRDPDRGHE